VSPRRESRAAALLLVAGVLVAALATGCAKRGVPPGGPEDRTAPAVLTTSPAGGALGVDVAGEIRIAFSEPMKHRTVETAVVVSPPCRWRKRHWQDNTYVLVPAEGLRGGATYLVSVGATAQDRHGVKMGETFVTGFSTGQTIEAGLIAGKVFWKGMAAEQAIVEVFDAAEVTGFEAFPAAAPVYVTLTGAGGRYEIPYVDTRRSYRAVAFLDKNLNTEYDQDETVGCASGMISFADSSAARGIDIPFCEAAFKGILSGAVSIAAFDTSAAQDLGAAVLATSLEDSSSYAAGCDKQGVFRIGCLSPGRYLVKAFVDLDGDQKQDTDDTLEAWFADTVTVAPCEETLAPAVTIGGDAGR